MFSCIIKTFSLGNQNCSVTDLDFLPLIAGKPLVKLYSLQVNSPLPCGALGGKAITQMGINQVYFLKRYKQHTLKLLATKSLIQLLVWGQLHNSDLSEYFLKICVKFETGIQVWVPFKFTILQKREEGVMHFRVKIDFGIEIL